LSCKEKELFLGALEKVILKYSKMEPTPATISIIERLTELGNLFAPRIPCSPLSSNIWKVLTMKVEDLERLDLSYSRVLADKLLKGVNDVQRAEWEWQQRVIAMLGGLSVLTLVIHGPSVPFYLTLMSSIISLSRPLEGGVFSAIAAIVLGLRYPLWGALAAFVSAGATFSFAPPVLNLEVEERERIPSPREEEVLNLFEKVYGRDGGELFRFELHQLMIYGMTKEEALREIWRRLTGEIS
jgi:hypothetical protein